MEDFVYVLHLEDKSTREDPAEEEIWVFSEVELARNKVCELKDRFLKQIAFDTCDYVIEDNSDSELPSFTAYESGFYDENHFELTTYQKEIV